MGSYPDPGPDPDPDQAQPALSAASAARTARSRRYGGSGGAASADPYLRRVQSYCGPSVAHRRRLRDRRRRLSPWMYDSKPNTLETTSRKGQLYNGQPHKLTNHIPRRRLHNSIPSDVDDHIPQGCCAEKKLKFCFALCTHGHPASVNDDISTSSLHVPQQLPGRDAVAVRSPAGRAASRADRITTIRSRCIGC